MMLTIILVEQRKKIVLTLLKQLQVVFFWVYITMVIKVVCVWNKDNCKFNGRDNIHWHDFSLGSTSKDLKKDGMSEVSLNGIVYDFSVDHSAIEKKIYLVFKNL